MPAHAQTVSARPDAVALTIYRDRPGVTSQISDPDNEATGLGLVVETRTIKVPAKGGRISFQGVAPGIVPQSAHIEGLPRDLIEQNFDYDLLSPGSLLAKSIGRAVRVARTNPATGRITDQTAIVRSAPDGVVLEIDGKIEALHCGALPERLIFDRIPDGVSDRPTLSVAVRAGAPGRYKVRLSYLATGFDWSADYVASVRPDGRTLDLSGWITLVNRTSIGFPDAPTQVVAGRWSRVDGDGTDQGPIEAMAVALQCWPAPSFSVRRGTSLVQIPLPPALMMAPAPMAKTEEIIVTSRRMATVSNLGDYKLYTLPEPTTVAARQTKQVGLLDRRDVPFERIYGFTVNEDHPGDPERSQPATVLLRLQNKAADHLGLALPAGTVSVRESDGRGEQVLAGEDKLDDLPNGLPFEIKLGGAIDVSVVVRDVDRKTVGAKNAPHAHTTLEATVMNGKPVPIVFELRQPTEGGALRLVAESQHHTTKGGDPLWTLRLAAGESQVVRYTLVAND
jgi:hypothetical protein